MEEVNSWSKRAEEIGSKAVKKVDPSPYASRELCYSQKEPWEPDHRCRGKGRVQYIAVHYDSDEEDMYKDVSLDASLENSQDSYTSNGLLESQDDSSCALVSRSYSVEDSTLHHSSDTCEDPARATPRQEEDRKLDDLPLDVGMRSCVGDNVPPRELSMAWSLPFQTHDRNDTRGYQWHSGCGRGALCSI